MNQQTIRLKLSVVPEKIREWFGSEEVTKQISEINKHFNISGDDRRVVPRLLLRLEIHDIEPEYFAGELAKELNMNRDKALGISAEVKRTILGPVKKELTNEEIDISLLDQFQTPIVKKIRTEESGPKIVEEIKPPQKPAGDGMAGRIPVVMPSQKEPLAPKPSWFASGKEPGPGPVDINRIFSAKPPSPPAARPTGEPLSEFARLGLGKNSPTAQEMIEGKGGAPTPPSMSSFGPKMIHEEEKMKPGPATDFKLDVPMSKLSDIKNSASAPPRPATIEFGQKKPEQMKGVLLPIQRVVNYSNLKTPPEQEKPVGKKPEEITKNFPGPEKQAGPEPKRFIFGAKKIEPPAVGPSTSFREGTVESLTVNPSTPPAPLQQKPPQPDNKLTSMPGNMTSAGSRTSEQTPPSTEPRLIGDEKMMHPQDADKRGFNADLRGQKTTEESPMSATRPPAPPTPRPRVEPPAVPPRPPQGH